jgi:dTDP-4-amino-4,6-dideoxygalactose transaminase
VLASQRVMSLPMSADLSDAQQDRVVSALKLALKAALNNAVLA